MLAASVSRVEVIGTNTSAETWLSTDSQHRTRAINLGVSRLHVHVMLLAMTMAVCPRTRRRNAVSRDNFISDHSPQTSQPPSLLLTWQVAFPETIRCVRPCSCSLRCSVNPVLTSLTPIITTITDLPHVHSGVYAHRMDVSAFPVYPSRLNIQSRSRLAPIFREIRSCERTRRVLGPGWRTADTLEFEKCGFAAFWASVF